MERSIIVPPELPLLSPKVIIQAFQLAVYRQVEFDPNTADYISFIYSHYPLPDFSGPLYNSSAFIPLLPEKFPAPGHGGSNTDILRICYPADWAVDRSALYSAVGAF